MHGDGEGTSSGIKIFGNIFISFIGAGILGLPYAFMEVSVKLIFMVKHKLKLQYIMAVSLSLSVSFSLRRVYLKG